MADPRQLRRPASGPLLAVLAAVTAVSVAFCATAYARFTSTTTQPQLFSTATLSPATDPVTAAGTCTSDESDAIVVSWTATPSTWADGYEVLRGASASGPYSVVGTTTGQSTTSYTDSGLAFSTTYHYQVRATKHAWRSTTTASVSSTTRNSLCA